MSAYFTIYAYQALKENLEGVDQMRFLFGDPGFLVAIDPDANDKKAFRIEDDELELSNRLSQKALARECAAWISDKTEIRSVRRQNLLHGKMYHIENGPVANAIVGSSNLTLRGMGFANDSNIELNLEVDSARDRRDLKAWFDQIWNDAELVHDVKAQVLTQLETLYADHSPEFIYFKTLFHVFERYLSGEADTLAKLDETAITDKEIWKALFEFQKDGVKAAIRKIESHNGCILADSVGLGKTYSALAVIKYYELRNHRVLVLCPKKLRENWTVYLAQNVTELNPFLNDKFNYTVLSHTDLSRAEGKSGDIDLGLLNWGNFDLVVIDESHNFRNNTKGKRDEDGHSIKKSRYERLMADIIQKGYQDESSFVVCHTSQQRPQRPSQSVVLHYRKQRSRLSRIYQDFRSGSKAFVQNAQKTFDDAVIQLLPVLKARSDVLLSKYFEHAVELTYQYVPTRYRSYRAAGFRDIEDGQLTFGLTFKGKAFTKHEEVLNEAKLSAGAGGVFRGTVRNRAVGQHSTVPQNSGSG